MNPIRILISAAATAAAFAAIAAPASAADGPLGVWMSDTGRGAIEIKSCDDGLCGHVVWVKEGSDTYGCGKQIIGEVQSSDNGSWGGGWIYSPERKKRYNVEIVPLNNGNLKVTGFAGVRFLSKTMIWKPAPADLQRCDAQDTAAPAAPKPVAVVKPALVTTAAVAQPAAAPAPAPAKPVAAAPAPKTTAVASVEPETEEISEGEGTSFNLDDGIEIGDVFSMKKGEDGKCKIKAPFVDLVVDCNRRR